jgi:hypothetical protein
MNFKRMIFFAALLIVPASIMSFPGCYDSGQESGAVDSQESLDKAKSLSSPINPNDFGVGDWNGDGYCDIYRLITGTYGGMQKKNAWVSVSDGKKEFYDEMVDTAAPNGWLPPYSGMRLFVGNFGGSYRHDMLGVYDTTEWPSKMPPDPDPGTPGSLNYLSILLCNLSQVYSWRLSCNFNTMTKKAVIVGDVNGDTNMDIVVIDEFSRALIYENIADQTPDYGEAFKSHIVGLKKCPSSGLPKYALGYIVGDDNKADLVICEGNKVKIAKSLGLSFESPVDTNVSFSPDSANDIFLVNNFDGQSVEDGSMDCLFIDNSTGNSTAPIMLAKHKNGKTDDFTVVNMGNFTVNANAVVKAGDVNGDYFADIISFEGNNVYVYLNKYTYFASRQLWKSNFNK